MSYINKNLLDGEKVVHQTHRHKIVFIWPFIWIVAGLATLFLGGDSWVFALVFGIVSLVHGGIIWLEYITSEFGVTNQRIIVKEGFIKRNTVEVFLKRIESVKVDQSILGRLFNFGTLVISGTGGAQDPFEGIPSPLEFKKKVQQQLASI